MASLQYSHMFRSPVDRKGFHPTQKADLILILGRKWKTIFKCIYENASCFRHSQCVVLDFTFCWTGGGKVNEELCDDIDKVESV